jgi:hypothetical protein
MTSSFSFSLRALPLHRAGRPRYEGRLDGLRFAAYYEVHDLAHESVFHVLLSLLLKLSGGGGHVATPRQQTRISRPWKRSPKSFIQS